MPASKQYTTRRRSAMLAVMWLLLLASVALAWLVSSHRRGVFQAKLDTAVQQDGMSIRLPQGWHLVRHSKEDSAKLFTVSDEKEEYRELQVSRNWLDTGETPVALVFHELSKHGATRVGEIQSKSINGCPAAIAFGELLSDEIPGYRFSFYVGAVLPPSGHATIVQYQCLNGDSSDAGLLQRVLESIQFKNEPVLSGKSLNIEGFADITLPDGFVASPPLDDNQTCREARTLDPAAVMKRLQVFPIILQARDSGNTIRTILSLTQSGFSDARVTEVKQGEYRIDPDANSADRAVRPIRAYTSTNSNGVGFLAVFKGGEDEQWIENAWDSIRDHATISDQLDARTLAAAGTNAVKTLADEGLSKRLPADPQNKWLLITRDNRNIGWTQFQPRTGTFGGAVETRVLIPSSRVVRELATWQGSSDLRSYRSTCDTSLASSESEETPKFQMVVKGSSQLRDGKLSLNSMPVDGDSSAVAMKIPDNFLPGGWLVDLLPTLPAEPQLLRCEMVFGYEYASASDLLTVLIRNDQNFKPKTDPDGDAESCKIVEVLGSGERWKWYFAQDGKLISIDGTDRQRFVAREEAEVRMSFSRNPALRPQ